MIVRETIDVGLEPAAAFSLFTKGIGRWWPLDRFSYGGERAQEIVLDARAGGRFYERFADGDELQVGTVLVCDPPERIVFTWEAPGWPGATEVEVTFARAGAGTRVDVEHRAFERLAHDSAAIRDGFANGWPTVLLSFRARAAAPSG